MIAPVRPLPRRAIIMGLFQSDRGLVEVLFVPVRFVDFAADDGKQIVKVEGLVFDDQLFVSENRGVWDAGDSRTRWPWSSTGFLVERESHDSFRAAWRETAAGMVRDGGWPVWRLRYRLVDGAKDTFRGRAVYVEVGVGLSLQFVGEAMADSVFAGYAEVEGS